jgi:hypothetical protein
VVMWIVSKQVIIDKRVVLKVFRVSILVVTIGDIIDITPIYGGALSFPLGVWFVVLLAGIVTQSFFLSRRRSQYRWRWRQETWRAFHIQ